MSGSWPSIASVAASSAAFCAFGSIVVVTCRPSVFSVCSLMSNRSSSSFCTCRSISPFGPVVWSWFLACSGGTVGGKTCAARSVGDSAPIVDHAVEHPVPSFSRAVGVDGRVQCGGLLNERGQQRAVGDGELFDRLVEVRLGRGGDAVGAAAEVDDVQIGLQHLVFGPFAGHLRRDDQLLGLADHTAQPGPRRAHQSVLDVLLGDRRPALGVAAEDVVLRRPGEPGEREAGVGVEVAVFGRHHRVAHVHRYLVDVDVDAIALGRNDFGEFTAVAGQDRRDLVGADVARLGHVDDQVGHSERHDRQHDQGGHRHVQPATDPLPVDLLHGGQTAGRPARRPAAPWRWTPRRSGGGGGFGGGVPSSAALTASIGSRSGRVSSRTDGMTAVSRSSGGTAGRRGDRPVGLARRECAHTVSSLSRWDIAG